MIESNQKFNSEAERPIYEEEFFNFQKNIKKHIDDEIKKQKTFFYNSVEEIIKNKLGEEGFYDFVATTVHHHIKDYYGVIIEKVIIETLQKLNKRFVEEEKRTRSLMLSIDSEIKAIVRNPHLAYDTQDFIKKTVSEILFKPLSKKNEVFLE